MNTRLICAVAAIALTPMASVAKTKAVAVSPNGASCTQARFDFCTKTYGDDMRPGWITNHCSRSPVGPRGEYLVPAWNCLRDQ